MTVATGYGSWDDASAERLTELRASGLSCTAIARTLQAEFKRHFTRNSVIGKASRLGLSIGEAARPSLWTPETTTQAEAMYKAGVGARTIAAELGVSLAAVYLKSGQRGWISPNSKPVAKPKPRPLKHSPEVVAQAVREGTPLPPHADPRTPDPGIALNPRPWTTREPGECNFPVDGRGADTWSCCNPVDRRGMCKAHAAICLTVSATDRERVRANRAFRAWAA